MTSEDENAFRVREGLERLIRAHQPRAERLEIRGLRLRASRMTLRASQGQDGAAVEMLARQGDAELVVRR